MIAWLLAWAFSFAVASEAPAVFTLSDDALQATTYTITSWKYQYYFPEPQISATCEGQIDKDGHLVETWASVWYIDHEGVSVCPFDFERFKTPLEKRPYLWKEQART